jgi:hypothetical protein
MHASEEGIASGRATLLGIIVHELRTFIADAINVRCFGCIQPMSSPMMKRMFGLVSCVEAGAAGVVFSCATVGTAITAWPRPTVKAARTVIARGRLSLFLLLGFLGEKWTMCMATSYRCHRHFSATFGHNQSDRRSILPQPSIATHPK